MNKNFKISLMILLAVSIFILGRFSVVSKVKSMETKSVSLQESTEDHSSHSANGEHSEKKEEEEVWTCSMHPQIKLPKPGKCPICAMDLIPLKKSSGGDTERQLSMSLNEKKLAEIQTVDVKRQWVNASIHLYGTVAFDESQVRTISSWVPGRLDKLYADYTGIPVKKNDHLASIYSPDLITAQEELIEAKKRAEDMNSNSNEFLNQSNQRALESAREKLRLWGISNEVIEEIESSKERKSHLTIEAPINGIVIHKGVKEGMYVETGTPLFTIADLDHLWFLMNAYESDLPWLKFGQRIEYSLEALPGEVFEGIISYIDPLVDPKTRTVKVRANIQNQDGKLKPDMYGTALIHSKVAMDGKVMVTDLKGYWICPMHPEVRQKKPGVCNICGMDLKPSEELGYKFPDKNIVPPLVVPESSVLVTGKRAVVYVEVPGEELPTYEGRTVVLGPKVDGYYIVESGLEEGESIVVNGNFKIDSALQIQAKPSMMSPEGGGPMPAHQHGDMDMGSKNTHEGHSMKTQKEVSKIVLPSSLNEKRGTFMELYFKLSESLVNDNPQKVTEIAGEFVEELDSVNMGGLSDEVHLSWMPVHEKMISSLSEIEKVSDLSRQRESYEKLSLALIDSLEKFGNSYNKTVHVAFCPMAFDNKGAKWVQDSMEIKNPYFGASMLGCGEIQKSFPGAEGGMND